jgi:hypothetical protein
MRFAWTFGNQTLSVVIVSCRDLDGEAKKPYDSVSSIVSRVARYGDGRELDRFHQSCGRDRCLRPLGAERSISISLVLIFIPTREKPLQMIALNPAWDTIPPDIPHRKELAISETTAAFATDASASYSGKSKLTFGVDAPFAR